MRDSKLSAQAWIVGEKVPTHERICLPLNMQGGTDPGCDVPMSHTDLRLSTPKLQRPRPPSPPSAPLHGGAHPIIRRPSPCHRGRRSAVALRRRVVLAAAPPGDAPLVRAASPADLLVLLPLLVGLLLFVATATAAGDFGAGDGLASDRGKAVGGWSTPGCVW